MFILLHRAPGFPGTPLIAGTKREHGWRAREPIMMATRGQIRWSASNDRRRHMARRAAEQAQLGFAPGSVASGLVMMATINEAAGELAWLGTAGIGEKNVVEHLRHGGTQRERGRRPIPGGSAGGIQCDPIDSRRGSSRRRPTRPPP